MDMGETLRLAREERGLSLEALSQRTKISGPLLRAIEDNDVRRLPGGIFLRGFLRAYAREVGLDPDDTVARYTAQFASHDENVSEAPANGNTEDRALAEVQTGWIEQSVREVSTLALVAIVVLAVGFSAYVTLREPDALDTTARDSAGASTATQSDGGPPTSDPLTVKPPEPVATSGDNARAVNLTIETVGPCWVSVVVDGRTVVYRLMQKGERQALEGGELVLRVGDPSTFTYAINGVAGKSLGLAGVPSTVHITAANYEQFTNPAR
jgi:cytoskeletal protein RodZ